MGGQLALAQSLTGLLTGHAWFLLAWRDEEARRSFVARAPIWLTRFISNRRAVAPGTTGPQPPGFRARGQETATPTGYNWGTGHRLGDS
ncbi:hypothetical protein Clacol_002667 [Clathrus columnatus]|uniref:Derlin n=1 Tax=Clathrus columnatus TaxID=1419009 RepID=A0AAV5A5C2_9AGAM|nr:hypothetical protein Clacol_002667 [Clathrus columnatus]